MQAQELLAHFFDRRPTADLPFVLGDTVDVIDGIYAGRRGEVVILAFAENPIRFLVEFDDGTDETFPASSLKLVHRAT